MLAVDMDMNRRQLQGFGVSLQQKVSIFSPINVVAYPVNALPHPQSVLGRVTFPGIIVVLWRVPVLANVFDRVEGLFALVTRTLG